MRFPQVSEKVKEAPANALRSVFAGIGQVMLLTDRMRKKTGEPGEAAPGAQTPAAALPAGTAPPAATVPAPAPPADAIAEAPAPGAPADASEAAITNSAPVADASVAPVAPVAGVAAEVEGPGQTATGQPATGKARTKPATGKPRTRTPATESPAAKPGTAAGHVRLLPDGGDQATPPASPVTTGEAPLPNYDQLTVASLRARMRGLSADQIRALTSYERAHANRPDVVAMFDRRVAKLEAPES